MFIKTNDSFSLLLEKEVLIYFGHKYTTKTGECHYFYTFVKYKFN